MWDVVRGSFLDYMCCAFSRDCTCGQSRLTHVNSLLPRLTHVHWSLSCPWPAIGLTPGMRARSFHISDVCTVTRIETLIKRREFRQPERMVSWNQAQSEDLEFGSMSLNIAAWPRVDHDTMNEKARKPVDKKWLLGSLPKYKPQQIL